MAELYPSDERHNSTRGEDQIGGHDRGLTWRHQVVLRGAAAGRQGYHEGLWYQEGQHRTSHHGLHGWMISHQTAHKFRQVVIQHVVVLTYGNFLHDINMNRLTGQIVRSVNN